MSHALEQREYDGRPSLLSVGPDWAAPSPVSASGDDQKLLQMNKLSAFVGANNRMHDHKDADSETESECSSAFAAGKSFWLNLLERTDSDSITTAEDDTRNRKTPTGRGVGRTWSTSSSVTSGSPFNNDNEQKTPFAKYQLPTNDHHGGTTTLPRRKVSVGNKWRSSPHNGSTRPPTPAPSSIINKPSKATMFSFALPPTPSQQQHVVAANSTPRNRRSMTPRAFGDDVTNLSTASTPRTPRTPGSVTNNHNNNNTPRQQQVLRQPGSIADRYVPSPVPQSKLLMKSPDHQHQPPNEFRTYSSSAKKKRRSESAMSDQGWIIPRLNTHTAKAPPSILATRAAGGKNQEKKPDDGSPSVDPIIVAGGHVATPTSIDSITASMGKMDILKLSPRSEVNNRFRWAYEVWVRVGLMSKIPTRREISPRVLSGISKYQIDPTDVAPNGSPQFKSPPKFQHSSPQFKLAKKNIEPPKNNRHRFASNPSSSVDFRMPTVASKSVVNPNMVESPMKTDTGTSDKILEAKEITTTAQASGINMMPSKNDYPGLKPISSTESETSGFRDILKQWRVKSDDKPNTHFLSPEQEAKAVDEHNDGRQLNGWKTAQRPLNSDFKAVQETRLVPHSSNPASGLVDSDVYEAGDCSVEDEGCRALVIFDSNHSFELVVDDKKTASGQELVVRNVELVTADQETALTEYIPCQCSQSVFSGNDDLISFFLPQMGMACTCGKGQRGLVNSEEPTAIENVLRPWQVDFLKTSFGIHLGDQLVKARHRSAGVMAKTLRQWRKERDMVPFKTESCGIAIDIWAKTCKTHVRSIRKQMKAGSHLLEQQPGMVLKELTEFIKDLPPAPPKRKAAPRIEFEPESQIEV